MPVTVYKPIGGPECKGVIPVGNSFIPQDPANSDFAAILRAVAAGAAKLAVGYEYETEPPPDLEDQILGAIAITSAYSHTAPFDGKWQVFFETALTDNGKAALDAIMA